MLAGVLAVVSALTAVGMSFLPVPFDFREIKAGSASTGLDGKSVDGGSAGDKVGLVAEAKGVKKAFREKPVEAEGTDIQGEQSEVRYKAGSTPERLAGTARADVSTGQSASISAGPGVSALQQQAGDERGSSAEGRQVAALMPAPGGDRTAAKDKDVPGGPEETEAEPATRGQRDHFESRQYVVQPKHFVFNPSEPEVELASGLKATEYGAAINGTSKPKDAHAAQTIESTHEPKAAVSEEVHRRGVEAVQTDKAGPPEMASSASYAETLFQAAQEPSTSPVAVGTVPGARVSEVAYNTRTVGRAASSDRAHADPLKNREPVDGSTAAVSRSLSTRAANGADAGTVLADRTYRIRLLDLDLSRAISKQDRPEVAAILQRMQEMLGDDSLHMLKVRAFAELAMGGDSEHAVSLLRQVLVRDPADKDAGLNMAVAEINLGEVKAAKTRLEALARTHPRDGRINDLLRSIR